MITAEFDGPVAVITLDRPEARNALTGGMLHDLVAACAACDADESIRAVVLTGRDPAFCAGLDLTDLAGTYDEVGKVLAGGGPGGRTGFPRTAKPLIGAVNGPAVTGGLELAIGCDILIASDRATFADTHARVGVMPGGGMTVRLPQLVGINRALQLSLTGNFIDAATACAWGLVTEVVDHSALLARATDLARAIAEVDPAAVAELQAMYAAFGPRADPDAYREEARWSRKWMTERFDPSVFAAKRERIIDRGSSQQG